MSKVKSQAVILGLVGLLWLVSPLAAQDTRLSGQWVLNHDKTQIPNLPDITIEISRAEGVIHYRKTVKDAQNEWLTQMDLPMDGREGGYTDFLGNGLKCSCAFSDGILTLTYQSKQRRSGQWVVLDMKDELSVSADGHTLSIAHEEHWDGKGGRWPRLMVFDRQTEAGGKVQDTKKSADSGLFPKQQLIEDSRELLSYLENIHPDPYLYSGGKVAFHRRFQDILRSIPPQGMAEDDFVRLLSPFIAALADAHTALGTAYSYDRTAPGGIPLSFASIEKCLYVNGVPSENDKAMLGAKLLSVEGVLFAELLKRVFKLRGVENDEHGLLILDAYLWAKPYLSELLPEWRDPTRVNVRLELRDGRKLDQAFALPRKIALPLVAFESKLKLPSTAKQEFAYGFLTPDKKTALLKVDGLMAYREMWESEGQGRDITKDAAEVYQRIHGQKPPSDPAAVLAGIPSAVETFRRLAEEMKEARTEALIIDLSQNRGGNSLMADILTYFLYGTQKLAQIVTEERSVKKYSPYFFEAFPGRSLDDINRQNAQVQSYPLTENDYDFADERYKALFRAGKIDLQTGMALKYADTPTFLAELKSGAFAKYYTPKKVIVTTSHNTFSSGFTMLRCLYQIGATVVGSTSGQSGNGFGNSTVVTLKNTGVRVYVSKNAYVVFPEEPDKRIQIKPHHELTYEKLESFGFDPNAVILYALELLKTKIPA